MNARLRNIAAVSLSLTLATAASAQNTAPFWSSYFGGTGRDAITSIAHGPGNLITIAGHTASLDLPTGQGSLNPTPLQPARGGSYDAFVARFDPNLPAAQQLLWCTYLGGSNQDYAFDLAVDASGVTTVVGVTMSTNFPVPAGQPTLTINGISDGFVTQIDNSGGAVLSSMLVGGSQGDYITRVNLGANSLITVLGVTESSDLPNTTGTAFPAFHGGATDTFVASVLPQAQLVAWATYLGADDDDGIEYSGWVTGGGVSSQWDGNLDLMDLAVDAAGNIAVATNSIAGNVSAATTPGAIQSTNAGLADVYFALLDPSGTNLLYGTYFGGSNDDIPSGLAVHPAGGFVFSGGTFSTDVPTTAGSLQPVFRGCTGTCPNNLTDGLVFHIDPALGAAGLRYSTYLGGDAGEDLLTDIAVESSGVVTVAGYCNGGNYPYTARSMQTAAPTTNIGGVITRLVLNGQGAGDLVYSTARQGTDAWAHLRSMVLDDYGNVIASGATGSTTMPVQNAFQSARAGGREGHLVWLPALPGCVDRSNLLDATPACSAPLYVGMHGVPLPGQSFSITATNAPPGALGAAILGFATTPLPLLNVSLLVSPGELLALPIADGFGAAQVTLSVPAALPAACPWGLSAQWVFLTNAACSGSGTLATSGRLNL